MKKNFNKIKNEYIILTSNINQMNKLYNQIKTANLYQSNPTIMNQTIKNFEKYSVWWKKLKNLQNEIKLKKYNVHIHAIREKSNSRDPNLLKKMKISHEKNRQNLLKNVNLLLKNIGFKLRSAPIIHNVKIKKYKRTAQKQKSAVRTAVNIKNRLNSQI